jgi:hypothetical protein
MAKTPHLIKYPNAITFRNNNRRMSVERREGKDEKGEDKETNVLAFVALTAEVGKEPGVSHGLHAKDKIKYSEVRLSDEALIDLYHSIKYYLKDVLKK